MTSHDKFSDSAVQEIVKKMADLARLELTADETVQYSQQLGKVLGYIEKLNEVKTDVEPMTTPLEHSAPLREDEVVPSLGAETILAPAPEQIYEGYKVPAVMGGAT